MALLPIFFKNDTKTLLSPIGKIVNLDFFVLLYTSVLTVETIKIHNSIVCDFDFV